MAKYRLYKNGIFGHRYNGYYIIRNDKKDFAIMDENKNVLKENLIDSNECEWEIDKLNANDEKIKILISLYKLEIYQLSDKFMALIIKKDREGLTEDEQELYKMIEKVRWRKAADREF